jgi:3-oxoacyl-[acyl-carrier protein] reductase
MNISAANILITGGARGIGNYLATSLAAKAKKVIIIDNNTTLLSEIPENIKFIKYNCDITDEPSVKATIEDIYKKHGGVSVLMNNAGLIYSELLVNPLKGEDRRHSVLNWDKVIDVNLNAVFYVTLHVAEAMIVAKNGGVIINTSSISAQGNMGQSAYAATKAAVEALTKTWSKELAMYKIRTACIAPGFFDTPSTHQSLSESMLTRWKKSVPLGRLGELEELLSAVEFIIRNDYFNGKILSLDGGLTI